MLLYLQRYYVVVLRVRSHLKKDEDNFAKLSFSILFLCFRAMWQDDGPVQPYSAPPSISEPGSLNLSTLQFLQCLSLY